MSQQPFKFTKMHGLGNDFVVINAVDQPISLKNIPITALANRHLGIGFNQLLIVSPSTQADFACRIFNSDGSEAEQCGNGLRCVARFIHEEKLSNKSHLSIALPTSIASVEIKNFQEISVDMGVPVLSPSKEIKLGEKNFLLNILSLGNPHALYQVEDINQFPVQQLGSQLSNHVAFPEGVNVGFMQIMSPNHIRLRTYERGAGETLACGSNSCAAVVAGINAGQLDQCVKVELPLGNLIVEWQGEGKSVKMTGPAAKIFDGWV